MADARVERPNVDDILSGFDHHVPKAGETSETNEPKGESTEVASSAATTNDDVAPVEGDGSSDDVGSEGAATLDAESTGDDADSGTDETAQASDDGMDEYGESTKKDEKTYTETEVNQMFRDRFQRGGHQASDQQIDKMTEDFHDKYDPESTDDWETQFRGFLRDELKSIAQDEQRKQSQAIEAQQKAQFESKFMNGMSKYDDFVDVVSGRQAKEISNDPAYQGAFHKRKRHFLRKGTLKTNFSVQGETEKEKCER